MTRLSKALVPGGLKEDGAQGNIGWIQLALVFQRENMRKLAPQSVNRHEET